MPSASDAAALLADTLLRPQAEHVDLHGVPRSHLDAVAAAGLYGPLPAVTSREVVELLAGADGSTWFVTAQHALPLLQATAAGHPLLPGLLDGSTPSGVAFAHLRRTPCPVRATRVDGGWRFDGTVDWTTGWGLVDLLLLGGATDDGRFVFALLPAVEQPGLAASAPLQLSAMQGTQTVRLTLTGLRADDADVTLVADAPAWLEADRLRTANAGPHTVGLVREAVARLAAVAARRE
ncbi:MAG: acyl-CoA dehydrogenase, partial [Frankiales bacterium]|nr:acyl-CoA dehydrogenase [Frankiales bacterium]